MQRHRCRCRSKVYVRTTSGSRRSRTVLQPSSRSSQSGSSTLLTWTDIYHYWEPDHFSSQRKPQKTTWSIIHHKYETSTNQCQLRCHICSFSVVYFTQETTVLWCIKRGAELVWQCSQACTPLLETCRQQESNLSHLLSSFSSLNNLITRLQAKFHFSHKLKRLYLMHELTTSIISYSLERRFLRIDREDISILHIQW